jgi:hypothetical protein
LLSAIRNSRGRLTLANSLRDPRSLSFMTISSVLNCKTTGQHSPLGDALLDPKNFTLHFNRKASDFIGDSIQINLERQNHANRRTR